jgi:hypothetical protein
MEKDEEQLSMIDSSQESLLTQPKTQDEQNSSQHSISNENKTQNFSFSTSEDENLSLNSQEITTTPPSLQTQHKSSQNSQNSQNEKKSFFSSKKIKIAETITIGSDEEEEIKIVNKRRNTETELIPNKKLKYEKLEKNNVCSICLEPWACSGLHQICCLECGHLFGKNCIEKWLNQKKNCPKCLQKSFKNQIRLLYHENISSMNDDQITETKKLLETERELRKEAEKKFFNIQREHNNVKKELEELKSKMKLKSTNTQNVSKSNQGGELKHEKFIFKMNIETKVNTHDLQEEFKSVRF